MPSSAKIESLQENAAWYRAHADIFASLAAAPAVVQYQQDLGRQREIIFRQLQPEIEAGLERLTTRSAVESYGNDFVLTLDNSHSATWQQIESRRAARVVEVEWEQHVARVGKGPFSPEHPGAVYLNALYRNDVAMIREEDTRYSTPFRTLMNPLNESGVYEIFALFSGGSFSADDIMGYMDSELASLSMADTLAGFFIVSFEHAYPGCMAGAVPMERTVYWDTVTTDGWGNELWRRTDSQTYHYNINRRHVAVFKQVGVGRSPEEAEMLTGLLGGLLPSNLRSAQASLSASLRGLRLAMQNMACNHPDMQQLEKNLLAAVNR